MSWGQSFGAFTGGMQNGYSGAQKIRYRKAQAAEPEKPGLGAIFGNQPEQKTSDTGADTTYEDQAWQMLRDMTRTDQPESESIEYSSSQNQQQSNGMSINPSALQKFMPSSGAGTMSGGSLGFGGGSAGLGGSGLIGSSTGAVSAGSTGGASFGLGGSLVGGSGTVGGSTFAAGGGASGGAAAGGSSAAGGIAAAGPWAALAAAIIGNETYQKKKGNRSEGGKYWTDLISGNKIVERDADTLGEKVDSGNKIGIKGDWQVAGDITSFDFSNAFKNLKNTTGVKTIKKLFGG